VDYHNAKSDPEAEMVEPVTQETRQTSLRAGGGEVEHKIHQSSSLVRKQGLRRSQTTQLKPGEQIATNPVSFLQAVKDAFSWKTLVGLYFLWQILSLFFDGESEAWWNTIRHIPLLGTAAIFLYSTTEWIDAAFKYHFKFPAIPGCWAWIFGKLQDAAFLKKVQVAADFVRGLR
jgi:hypothetical protein